MTEICALGSNWHLYMDLDNGFVPYMWQAIIWTNDGLGWWHIYASLVLNELLYKLVLNDVVVFVF